MKILIYIGHPAQFHFFKYAIRDLKEKGHEVIILIKTKDILEQLLKESGLPYCNIQKNPRKNSKLNILLASFQRTLKVVRVARKRRVDILVGTDSSIAQAGWLLKKPSITTLEDDYDIIKNLALLTYPFTTKIFAPNVCDVGKWQRKKTGYEGYMKLAYLHPRYFTPDSSTIEKYNLPDKFILIRIALLSAHHDAGIKGLNPNLIHDIIETAHNQNYEVRISAEISLPDNLKDLELRILHKDIHHVMSFASLLISDSQSMSVEAAMLGLPSLRFSDFAGKISVLDELEIKYGLTKGIPTSDPNKLLEETKHRLSNENLRKEYEKRRKTMLSEKIDVTQKLIEVITTTANKNCHDQTTHDNRGEAANHQGGGHLQDHKK